MEAARAALAPLLVLIVVATPGFAARDSGILLGLQATEDEDEERQVTHVKGLRCAQAVCAAVRRGTARENR
jgi:hypothetical protein|eukprot:674914-Prymnesium_polylepis.1